MGKIVTEFFPFYEYKFTLVSLSSCFASYISVIAGSFVAKTSKDTHSNIVVTKNVK